MAREIIDSGKIIIILKPLKPMEEICPKSKK